MLETSVRLLRLLALLPSRRDWPGPELARRLGVTTRTVRNDVERLRLLGYEVRSTSGVAGGYRLGAGSQLPPLLLDDEEATAVAISLHAAAGGSVAGAEEAALRALTKLDAVLPARVRRRVDALRTAVVSVPAGGPAVDPQVLADIAAGVRDRTGLRLDYTASDGATSLRTVEPHRLVHTGRRWYLLAFDTGRDDWRTFRVDRLRLRTPGGPRFVPREVPGGDPVAFVLRGVGSTAWPHPARVRLHAPAAVMAERLTSTAGVLADDGPGTCVLETGGSSMAHLAGYLLSLDVEVEVLHPPELRAVLTRAGERATRAGRPPSAPSQPEVEPGSPEIGPGSAEIEPG